MDIQNQATGAFEWYKDAFKNFAKFEGRTQRRGYWYFTLINFLIGIAANIVDYILASTIGIAFVSMIYGLVVIIPSLSLGARRLHDIGKSGWWQLLGLIPLIGAIVLIIFFATASTPEDNQYGPYKP